MDIKTTLFRKGKAAAGVLTALLIPALCSHGAAAQDGAAYDTDFLLFTAVPEHDMCYVGDKTYVDITLRNDFSDGTDLNDLKVTFEGQEIFSDDVFEPGEDADIRIGLLAWDEDVDSGGKVTLVAECDKFTKSIDFTITVRPDSERPNPRTGTSSPAAAILTGFAAAALLGKRLQRGK